MNLVGIGSVDAVKARYPDKTRSTDAHYSTGTQRSISLQSM